MFRALFAAAVVLVSAFGGALFLGHTHAAPAIASGSLPLAGMRVAIAGQVDPNDEGLLDEAYTRVERTYYEPPPQQKLLDGERAGLAKALAAEHVETALPAMIASGDDARDLAAMHAELERALALAKARGSAGAIDPATITQAGVRGMLASLNDPYTVYLTAAEINSLEESLRGGDFGGIGIYIFTDPQTKDVLIDPIAGTPAAKAGLHAGDVIVKVNGASVRGMKLDDVEHAIRGRIGTAVELAVRRRTGTALAAAASTVSVVRERIYVPSVTSRMDGDIDYIYLSEFGEKSYDEVRSAVLAGVRHHARGYILDLRDDGGGLLDEAVRISSLFIPRGVIVTQIDRAGDRLPQDATHSAIGAEPLVVLVNKYTASSSEITAGAIQDYGVGKLVGERTFGKGVVQSIYGTADGGALKITTARYVTPKGRDIQHLGIEPDIVVDQSADRVALGSPGDVQLAAAKAYLSKLARR